MGRSIVRKHCDGCGEILIRADVACVAIAHDACRAAIRSDDGGNTGGQRLQHHVAEGVGVRGEDEGIHVGVGARQIRAAKDSGELCALQAPAQPRLFPAVANDEEAEIARAILAKLLFNAHQQRNILLDREASDKTQNEVCIVRATITIGRRKGLRVHAAGHQVAGTSGGAFEDCAKLRVRREEHARLLVIECRAPECRRFDLPADARAAAAEEMCEPAGAGGRVLVHIGMPGGDQGHAQAARDPCADETKLGRARDVEDVRAKAPSVCEDARQMPPIRKVEAQIFLDRKGECAAWKLECADRAILAGAIGRSCAHAEKGEAAPAGEGFKMPAGMRDAVDFVEGVRKIRDSGWKSEWIGERRSVRRRGHDGSVCGARAEAEGRLDGLTLAESEVQLPRFVPGQTQAATEWCMAHEAYELDAEPQHQRRVTGGPERAYRLRNVVRVRVIDALIPAARALRESRDSCALRPAWTA